MNRTQFRNIFLLFTLFVFVASLLSAADAPIVKHGPRIIPMTRHGVSRPLRDIPPAASPAGVMRVVPNRMIPRPPLTASALASRDDDDDFIATDGVQTFFGAMAMPSTSVNFEGMGAGLGGFTVHYAPPDTTGEVGPNHYVQMVNTEIAVFNKTTGAQILTHEPINTIWTGFGGDCETDGGAFGGDGDPTVNYDQIADRWVIAQFAVEGATNKECVAVSKNGDPTGEYWLYEFDFGSTDFNDYPKLAVWPDAYYATYNMFGNTARGVVCAMDRTNMLAGSAATQQCFDDDGDGGLLAADLDGSTLPPGGSPEFVMQMSWNNFNTTTANLSGLKLWKFHVDFATPGNTTFTGPTIVGSTVYGLACATRSRGACIKEPNTTQKLESLNDRLMNRLAYRNFGTHESLVANHAARLGAKPGNAKTGIHWYEIRDPNGTPTIFQEQTYAPDKTTARWMGSIAMDKLGDIAMGFSVSNKKAMVFPGIRYTGRLVGDIAGQMTQGEAVMQNGTGSQNFGLARWGDYAGMTVDPADDCTFWFTTEYIAASGSFNWHTRIASFKFPGCI